jgi:hypothetical protein
VPDVLSADANETLGRLNGDSTGLTLIGTAANFGLEAVDIAVGRSFDTAEDDIAMAVDDGDATEDVQSGTAVSSRAPRFPWTLSSPVRARTPSRSATSTATGCAT